MALTEEEMKMWQGVSDHLTRMENDAEYRKKIEKQLYRGAPKKSIERIRQVGIKNGQSKLVGAIKKIDFSSNAELIKIQDEAIVLAENSLVIFKRI